MEAAARSSERIDWLWYWPRTLPSVVIDSWPTSLKVTEMNWMFAPTTMLWVKVSCEVAASATVVIDAGLPS